MWDSITYVEPSRHTVIHEGVDTAHIVITNAGPGNVDLLVWDISMPIPSAEPIYRMHMPPGNTRSTSGSMIAVGLSGGKSTHPPQAASFAAVAWRIVL